MSKAQSGPARKALVVIGMHRSGTSAMARVLALAGAALPTNLMPPSIGNPAGHWEPKDVADLNDRMLTALGSEWLDPFGPRGARSEVVPLNTFFLEACEIIDKNYADQSLIVMKEPRISILLKFWIDVLQNRNYEPVFIIMVRHPLEVARSLLTTHGLVNNKSILLWTNYLLHSEKWTRSHSRIFVKFDDLLADPESVLDGIEENLQLLLPGRTCQSLADTNEFLRPELATQLRVLAYSFPNHLKPVENLYSYLHSVASGMPENPCIIEGVRQWLSDLEKTVGPLIRSAERDARNARSAHTEIEAGLQDRLAQAADEIRLAQDRVAAMEQELAAAKNSAACAEAELADRLSGSEGPAA